LVSSAIQLKFYQFANISVVVFLYFDFRVRLQFYELKFCRNIT